MVTSGSGSARPLRGRSRELDTIAAGLAQAAAGQARAFVVVGEPGIGKTRLAVEVAEHAARAGFTACWGRSWEAGGAPAYWPWRQLCESFGGIAQLAGRDSAAADPDQARFELFDAVTRGLRDAAAREPMLCILDDLHAADVPSLELAAFATRHLRASHIAWLLTWRDAEATRMPVRDQLARIAREATVIPLSTLSVADANELIDDVRCDADRELRAKLVRATGGNPLFLLETLACLATGSALPSDLEQLPLAQGIATIVQDRLAPLPASTRRLVEAASVVGRDVELARWVTSSEVTADAVRDAAPALVGAGVLVALGRDRWRFAHDLVREAIYRNTADAERAACHRRLAYALDAGERAHHALHARLDDATLIEWTVAAGEHARAQCAYEEAFAVIERAIAQIGPHARRDPALQLALGRAQLDLGNVREASDAFHAAIALARDPQMVAAAVLSYGSRYVLGDIRDDLVALIDDAMARLPASEVALRARLLARKAAALTPAADPAPCLEMAREADQLAAGCGDDAARLEVAVAVGSAFADFAHPRERARVNELVVSLARARGDRAVELRGLSRLVTDHVQAGDFMRADAVLATRDALARALVQPRFAWQEPLFRSMRAMVHGDFAVCDAAVDEAAGYAGHDPNVVRVCAVHRTWLLFASDRVDELRAYEPTVMAALRTMRPTLAGVVRAMIRLRSGDLRAARREVDALEPGVPFGRAIMMLATLGEVVAEVGPPELAGELYDLLAPYADVYMAWGLFGLACGPPVAATLGMLATDRERARAHFESAIAMTTAANACVGRAWTSYWFGRALAASGDPEAARLLDDAAREATRLGMSRLAERCRAIDHAPAAAPVPAPAAARFTMVEQAGAWLVTSGGRSFLVPNLRGMPILARLAGSPHVEVHSLELVAGVADDVDSGDAGELLDDKARATYRKRVAALADEIEEAEARGDIRRVESARDEHDALVKELSRAVGLGGKVRRAGAAGERARITAQRRLREAIRKIAELDAELGRHLDKAVRTGTFCTYRP